MAIIETDHHAITSDGRAVALLRGETRQMLDYFLVHSMQGTGVGRSAFILTAVDFFTDLSMDQTDPLWIAFVKRAKANEEGLA